MIALCSLAFAGPIEDAVEVRQSGDLDGARKLLVALEPLVTDQERGWYLYQRAVCEELDHHPDLAEGLYRRAIEEGGDSVLDAHFRLALVLDAQGREKEALAEMVWLDRRPGLPEDDETTIALQRGIVEVRSGKTRVGVRRIERALAGIEEGHRYMRAKARFALVEVILGEAGKLTLDGPERRVVKRLKRRAVAIKDAEAQVVALTAMEEPEWILAGLLTLGDGYLALADAVATSPAPRKLSPEAAAVYRVEVRKKAENARTRAWHVWDQGVALALRLGYESPRVAELRARRDSVAR